MNKGKSNHSVTDAMIRFFEMHINMLDCWVFSKNTDRERWVNEIVWHMWASRYSSELDKFNTATDSGNVSCILSTNEKKFLKS